MPNPKEVVNQKTADIQAELETKSADELNALLAEDESSDEAPAAGADETGEVKTEHDEEKADGEKETAEGEPGDAKAKAEDKAAPAEETTGGDPVEKLTRRVEEKDKIIGRQGSELGQLRALKNLMEKFNDNPEVAIDYFDKLKKQKYGDKPKDVADISDDDIETIQTALLSDDKTALKSAFVRMFEKATTKQRGQQDIQAAQQEAEKANQTAVIAETKNFLTSLNPEFEQPEMISIIKEIMVESGVKPEYVETGLSKFFLLPRDYTAAWVTEAKARHKIAKLQAEIEQTKSKTAGIFDKISAKTRTNKGVTSASGQAIPKADGKKPSPEDMQRWSKEELEKYLNEKEE